MANLLSFAVVRDDDTTIITPVIDGQVLTEAVAHFERGCGYDDPAGGYGGLVPEFYQYGPLDLYFLGQSDAPWMADAAGRISVLACECGELGCWPLTCEVTATETTVTWRDFRQPHRPGRDYSAFGPFVFPLGPYKAALRSLA